MEFLRSLFRGSATTAAVTAADARAQIDGAERLFVLDVRQPEEFRSGHIDGATLIPLADLAQRLGELPKNRRILCVCQSGSRSGAATHQLVSASFDAVNLRGGMIAWRMAGFPVRQGT